MSKIHLSYLLAFYACLGWGVAPPLIVRMSQHTGIQFNPLVPYVYNTVGNILLIAIAGFFSKSSLFQSWTWHWTGWALLWFWPSAGLVFIYALKSLEGVPGGNNSVISAIAATYPVLISAPLFWLWLGESMSFQKIVGIALTVLGIVIATLAK